MTPGRLITLEGGEGAGKSTNARYIQTWLEQRGRSVLLTREPGGSPLAEDIRHLVLKDWDEGMPGACEILLMFAARSAHLQNTILPALNAGKDVICDRFIDSSYAYQGAGKGVPLDHIKALEDIVMSGFSPALTVVFDLDPESGIRRTQLRGEQNRFEWQTPDYLRRVRAMFLERAQAHPARCAVLDAGRPLDQVQADLARILQERLCR